MSNILNKIRKIINSGGERSARAKKSILRMFVNKGASIFLSLLYVPLFLSLLDQTRYGIWVTIMSLINWIGFFDIGIGQGLRNLLAENLAKGDIAASKKLVSTSYTIMSIIFFVIALVFIVLYPYVNWYKVVNAPLEISQEINLVILIAFILQCVNFVLSLFRSILLACQKPDVSSDIHLINQFASIAVLYVFKYTIKFDTLIPIALTLTAIPIIVVVTYSIIFFSKEFKPISPSIRYFDKKYIKSVLSLGGSFFFIQLANLLLFQSNNLLISNLISPEAVSEYYIANKYMSLLFMLFSIISTPYWSAVTDAYARQEYSWIKMIKRNLLKVFLLFLVGGILMVILAPVFFRVWIGNKVAISMSLVVALCIYNLLQILSNIYLSIVNGVGKIKLQLIITVIQSILYIPLCIVLCKHLKIVGIIISGIVMMVINCVIYSIQCNKLTNGTKYERNIWYK